MRDSPGDNAVIGSQVGKPEPAIGERVAAHAARTFRLAYLTTKYPSVSHTFIRRELREIERRGHSVLRLAIRPSGAALVDPLDQEEVKKTIACLAQPSWRLVTALLRVALTHPIRILRGLRLVVQMGVHSERGLLRHLAYLVEACYLLLLLRRHDIQHVHVHFGTNPAAVARLIRRLGGPPYSFTVHGPDEFDSPVGLDLAGKICDAAFVVAITDFCAAQLRRWAAPENWSKINVVRCTVGDEFFRAAQPINPDCSTLVCVGRLAPQKGQLLLLDAFAQIIRGGADARLIFAGDGELRPGIEQRVAEFGLCERVEITGYVPEAEIRRQILGSRVLVLPSFAEGLPMVIMEAFALGRPVISTYVAGIPELVRPSENGWLVPAGNVELLAGAIREALDAPAQRLNEMAAAGREATRKRHYLRIEVDRLENLFLTSC
jgi:glycosyltransferase involved in cell wall biosynthesis